MVRGIASMASIDPSIHVQKIRDTKITNNDKFNHNYHRSCTKHGGDQPGKKN